MQRFRKLYSALREWKVARTAMRQQSDALFGLDAHILDDIGIGKAMLLDCETGSSIYPDPGSRREPGHEPSFHLVMPSYLHVPIEENLP
jgi:hypothetical protein